MGNEKQSLSNFGLVTDVMAELGADHAVGSYYQQRA